MRGQCVGVRRRLFRNWRLVLGATAIGTLCIAFDSSVFAQELLSWDSPWQAAVEGRADQGSPIDYGSAEDRNRTASGTFALWDQVADRRTVDYSISPAEFAHPDPVESLPRPSFLEPDDSEMSVAEEVRRLHERIDQLETARTAQEDATRTIIRQSFAEQGANINAFVLFGGTLETLTFWQTDFDDVAESDIVLDTAELDFEVTVNSWSVGSLVIEYFDGTDFLFPTNEGDEIGVDRFLVRQGIITVGDTTRYPLFMTIGRAVVPFGISTGDPVADVLTIVDPLTVEVFETREDFVLLGFEWPTPPPPPPVSAGSPPAPLPPRPLLINPLVRRTATRVCEYCGLPPVPPAAPVAVPPTCTPPFSGAIYFYNGDTVGGPLEENHIEHIGGTLGYRTKRYTWQGIPWSVDFDVDVNSSVFDSNFLQFEYRSFLDQIGFVPGMAAHVKSNLGPVALVIEWNGAVADADFIDDVGTPVSIRPQAWQIALAYQFDWNPSVEIIGLQGTYFTIGYSESSDLAGVSRIFDPLAAVPVISRVGFVPERRLSVGIGEWVLDGLRVALEYSHAIDYDEADGGTGNSADGVFWQLTYEW
ncbi:MAG: hypothetical protein L0228_21905 [Planctomycetes bacterium]|nr:hypothetical protein [Planctomycetota bacterium]